MNKSAKDEKKNHQQQSNKKNKILILLSGNEFTKEYERQRRWRRTNGRKKHTAENSSTRVIYNYNVRKRKSQRTQHASHRQQQQQQQQKENVKTFRQY